MMKRTVAMLIAAGMTATALFGTTAAYAEEKKSVGFVTFGLGGDFFQNLADTFVEKMNEEGWDAQYADGEFNPTTQIEAMENYVAMGMDEIVLWSVAPEAMDTVVADARKAGVKVIAFVAPTSEYDTLMVADNAELADSCAKLAAKWIDETFADAEDHSDIPVIEIPETEKPEKVNEPLSSAINSLFEQIPPVDQLADKVNASLDEMGEQLKKFSDTFGKQLNDMTDELLGKNDHRDE